ncbi:MAG TPA: AI-2E family transporter [Acetobacteraceae bacterium]|nr:AI-2E family transporter [Acetobacteraceae bacterium]
MSDAPPPTDPLPAQAPARVAAAETPGLTGLLTLAIAVVVIAGLYLAREVLIPITLAVLLSFLLAPLANLLRWARLGRVMSAILAVVLAVSVILAVAGLIGTQVAGLASDVPRYQYTVQQKIDTVRTMTIGRLQRMATALTEQISNVARPQTQAKPVATPAHRAGPGAGRGASADPDPARDRAARPGAGDKPAVHDRDRLRRRHLHSAAARGSARPADPPVRFGRPAPHDGRDG